MFASLQAESISKAGTFVRSPFSSPNKEKQAAPAIQKPAGHSQLGHIILLGSINNLTKY